MSSLDPGQDLTLQPGQVAALPPGDDPELILGDGVYVFCGEGSGSLYAEKIRSRGAHVPLEVPCPHHGPEATAAEAPDEQLDSDLPGLRSRATSDAARPALVMALAHVANEAASAIGMLTNGDTEDAIAAIGRMVQWVGDVAFLPGDREGRVALVQ